MIRIFLRALVLLMCLLLIPVTIGFFLPRTYSVSAEIKIEATADSVFDRIESLRDWQSWSPWNSSAVPGLAIQFAGPESGPGAEQTWQEPRGSGKLWVTESERPSRLKYKMEFGAFPEMSSTIALAASNSGTVVTWTSAGRLPPGPFYGWFSGIFESGMQQQYEQGLEKLKNVCEADR